MKTGKICMIIVLILASKLMFGQEINQFLDDYSFYQRVHSEAANYYKGINGNPYLNSEFVEGVCRLKDTTAVKLQLRYNIYADAMEYQLKEVTYSVGNPQLLDKVILGESVFAYLPSIQKGGYFEVFEPGKCLLAQKRVIKFYPAEQAKPIEGISKPARFITESDIFYMVNNSSEAFKITNMKSVINALQDQKAKIESYIGQEKIKNTKKENLIKIVKYYNSL